MKLLARWAWVVVLGTALALSWWSLDTLARHYGMPAGFAAMVSATFDGSALVAADLAMRRAAVADSAAAVKLLMLATVGLSAWLNYQHGALLHYPFAVRMLFACPAVIGGSLFELQLQSLHRSKLHELGRTAEPLPRFGLLVWAFHPFAALRRVSQIMGSRLHSIPVNILDWADAPTTAHVQSARVPIALPRIEVEAQTPSGPSVSEDAAEDPETPQDGAEGRDQDQAAHEASVGGKRPRLGATPWE